MCVHHAVVAFQKSSVNQPTPSTLLDFSPGPERDLWLHASLRFRLTTQVHFDMLHMHDAPASKRDEHTPLALATSCRLSSADSHYVHVKSTASRRRHPLELEPAQNDTGGTDAFFRALILQVSKSPHIVVLPGRPGTMTTQQVSHGTRHTSRGKRHGSHGRNLCQSFAVQSRDRTLVIPMRTV